ncbi:hypothetical protein E3N88_30523 [Mikania micrantha]|uniref:LIM zinc-binding domain-containing protein n=1 Tax=Mikania micrantha TaxID=192012 RepID=A0A5N6MMS9_9ASTR|nr:hypothetical protein E3N88_30523 [Mikania micrantha]
MSSYFQLDGSLYCKPHFDQKFKELGGVSRMPSKNKSNEGAKTPSKLASKLSSMFSGTQDKCAVCHKTVYPLEKVTVEGEFYHNQCFRCAQGGCKLTPSNYAALDGNLFCKPHFAQLFKEKDRIELSIDPGTWEPMDEDMVSLDPIEFHSEEEPYKNRIDSYQRKTGLTEAIQTGIGQLDSINLVAVVVIVYGVWMSSQHDGCHKSLTLPVIGLGSIIFLISIIGFMGALKNNSILLLMYLLLLCLVLVGILVFTVLVFIVTNNASGHNVAGLRYKEYQLQDYGSWFIKKLNNTHNWKHLRSCFVKAEVCNSLPKRYKTLRQYKLANLTPIEASCCRPPSQCGYPAVNASYYDLSFHPVSSNKDCKLYKNLKSIKCYSCDSCK